MVRSRESGVIEYFDEARIRECLDWSPLIAALRQAFAADDADVPRRHRHALPGDGDQPGTLLIMPAWNAAYLGVKVANVFPGNQARRLPTVSATYLLMDAATGRSLAFFEAEELTARRTAAASLLAASRLARVDAATLLVVGAGRVARQLVDAYSAQFPLQRVVVWNHRVDGAKKLVAELRSEGRRAQWSDDLAASCRDADIVTCATLSTSPLVRGDWLRPGTHVDLVGGFTPAMREADDALMRRARVYVDSLPGALAEAGDIVQPVAAGVLDRAAIAGDLFALARGAGNEHRGAVTVFKSVGHALEDLVAAATAYEATG